MGPKSFWNPRIGARTFFNFFMYKGSLIFDSVYIKGNQTKLFLVKYGVFHCRVYYKIAFLFTVLTKNGGGDH